MINSKHFIGTANELLAASYFTDQGYSIYWPIQAQSRADFIMETPEGFKTVQVKTATWSETKPYKYLQCRVERKNEYNNKYKEGDFDLIVFVDRPRLWVATFNEVKDLVSVCLDGTKPGYKCTSKLYDPEKWLIK